MRDEQVRQPLAILNILQQVDDLRLNGNVQRADRFIGDNELRLYGQCTGNPDPLALTTGELMGIASCVIGV